MRHAIDNAGIVFVSPGLSLWDKFCVAGFEPSVERFGSLYSQLIEERRKATEAQYVEYNKINRQSRGSGTKSVGCLCAVVQKKRLMQLVVLHVAELRRQK